MDTVVVGGPHSGVGKTLASEIAIRSLTGRTVGAVKLTVADGERDRSHDHGASALTVADAAGICGRGMSCGVCETVSARVPSRLITAHGAIRKPTTDTCRLADAGAVAVAWVISLRDAAPAAIGDAILYLKRNGADIAVIEGTTALEWLTPRASVLVATDPGRAWKRVALAYVDRCDIVLHNRVPIAPGDVPAPQAFLTARPIRCDLANSGDRGTIDYVKRLQALCGINATQDSNDGAASAAR